MKKMTKLTALLLALCLLFGLCACSEQPKDDTETTDAIRTPDGLLLREEGYSFVVVGYEGTSTNVTVPERYEDKLITALSASAFYGNEKIGSVHLPASVQTIHPFALAGCTNLTTLTVDAANPVYRSEDNCIIEGDTLKVGCRTSQIPSSVKKIGDYAFYGCSGLAELTVPGHIEIVGNYAFAFCRGLTSLTLQEGLREIGTDALFFATKLTSLTLPASLEKLATGALSTTTSIETLTVAEGNQSFHSNGNCIIETATGKLVAGCRNSVIPTDGSVKSIGAQAFYGCAYLKQITIPASVCLIQATAFSTCYSLSSVTFALGGWTVSGEGSDIGAYVPVTDRLTETGHPISEAELTKNNALLLSEEYTNMIWRNQNAE